MFSQSTQTTTSEEFAAVAETLADLLAHGGDPAGANEVLSIVSRQANTPALALRRAEHHLSQCDPSSALAALIPVWEAGYEDQEVESLMGITSLILGLDDVVENLTDRTDLPNGLKILRWVLSCCDTELQVDVNLDDPHIQWGIVRIARILSAQGRTDIVGAINAELEISKAEKMLDRLGSIPQTPWVNAHPIHPPIDRREEISKDTTLPAIRATYNWVWASARQVFRGERVLLLGVDVERFEPLFSHAVLTIESLKPGEMAEAILDQCSSGAFEHVVLVYGYETSCSTRDVTRLLWRALRHGGQLHLVGATHHYAAGFDTYIHPRRVEAMLDAIGFEMMGRQLRDEDGVPVDEMLGRILVLRAQKNLV